jgi:cobalt-zinc-cadmium efflux system protein
MHDHRGHQHAGEAVRARNRRALSIALTVTAVFAVVELAGGIVTGSLALVADAGHMATDVLALGLSLFAAWMAGRPSTPRKSYGYYRTEILAALANGAALVAIAAWIAWEAIQRLASPRAVEAGPMILIAFAGLLANFVSGSVLLRQGEENLNVHAAFLHVAGDAVGALGAMVAGAVILRAGWRQADPLVSLVIAALILVSSWRILREAVDVLLEGTPARINPIELEDAMTAVPGVASVHDVHCWTVTSGFVALSGHAELDGTANEHQVLDRLTEVLTNRFQIAHVTIQPEPAAHVTDCYEPPCEPNEARLQASRRER